MEIRPRELCRDCANNVGSSTIPGLYDCKVLSSPNFGPSHCFYYDGGRWPVDIVIITAVAVERNAVLAYLHPRGEAAWEPIQTVSNGIWRTCLYRSPLDSRARARLAIAKTKVTGLSAAASLTALAIQLFRPTHVVMLGITAGHRQKTNIGDIVVPLELWDMAQENGRTTQEHCSSVHVVYEKSWGSMFGNAVTIYRLELKLSGRSATSGSPSNQLGLPLRFP
jgi:Phosphorylase superfamily